MALMPMLVLAVLALGAGDPSPEPPVRFGAEVMPILARHGCNAGACHGKAGGQNGFRLSLLGSDARADWEAIAREGQGRRADRIAPEASLLLLKATGRLPHGGGRRFGADSPEARTLARWIAQGMLFDEANEPALVRLEVEPARWVATRGETRRLRAVASFGDGTTRDVTRLASFGTNDVDLAGVDEWGEVLQAGDGVGEAAILARFGGLVAVSRVVVPSRVDGTIEDEPESANPIDPLVARKLRELGIRASGPCTDAEFARRSALDICGVLPRPEEVAALEADSDPGKRAKWVDRLLDRPEYADLFAMKWSALLRNKRTLGPVSQPGTFAFHDWIRQAFAENRPFDRFATDVLTAKGDAASNPAVVWFRQVATTEERVDDAAQVFLGVRIGCARCHHHPTERWTQDDYYGFASVFARVGTKSGTDLATPSVFTLTSGLAANPETRRPLPPRPPGGPVFGGLGPRDDPRMALADWLRRPDNPYFARAIVNRTWKHFLGRGLVEPEDDFRASNPPTDPDLLDALADVFVASGYDVKHLIRVISTSRAYGRSSVPNDSNRGDRRYFARFRPRRLPAEVLLDAVDVVAGTTTTFPGLPSPTRAVQLPDDGFDSRFLDLFGRPRRLSASECERTAEANLAQALHLFHSGELQARLARPTGRAATMARDVSQTDAAKVDELYRIALSRPPDRDERAACLTLIARRRAEDRVASGYEDVIWALLNTKAFLFVH